MKNDSARFASLGTAGILGIPNKRVGFTLFSITKRYLFHRRAEGKIFRLLSIAYSSLIFVLLACGLFSLQLLAEQKEQQNAPESLEVCRGPLCLSRVIFPPMPPASRMGVIYLDIRNQSSKTVVLQSLKTPLAAQAMIHQSEVVDGMSKMRHLNQLSIAPGQTYRLKPKATHIMLMGIDPTVVEQSRKQSVLMLTMELTNDKFVKFELPFSQSPIR